MFDSGVGGTSIWKEVRKRLPYEDTIFLADSKNAPYGEKSEVEIRELSIKNTELLLEQKCKLIIVACNTATTNAIDYLRKTYRVPFIGIEPAIKPAALQSTSKTVGILATKGTLSSSLFHSTAENYAAGIQIVEQEGTGLVPLIEAGQVDSEETRTLLKRYLAPMIKANIDYLVLGCTHYPYLVPTLRSLLPKQVKIIDSGAAVAKQTEAVLEKNNALKAARKKGLSTFFTNHKVETLASFLTDSEPTEIAYLNF